MHKFVIKWLHKWCAWISLDPWGHGKWGEGRGVVGGDCGFNAFLTTKTKPIERIAVRETGVSRNQGGSIEVLPESLRVASQNYRIEGLMVALN